MILSYHAVPTEEEMFFISRPLLPPFFFGRFTQESGKIQEKSREMSRSLVQHCL